MSELYCEEENECMEVLTYHGRRVKFCEKHRALHSQVRELERERESRTVTHTAIVEQKDEDIKTWRDANYRLQARITALEAERDAYKKENSLMAAHQGFVNYDRCLQRITQLEGALKAILSEIRGTPSMDGSSVWHTTVDGARRIREQAQHALRDTPEAGG